MGSDRGFETEYVPLHDIRHEIQRLNLGKLVGNNWRHRRQERLVISGLSNDKADIIHQSGDFRG